jgi:hypothetical protein
MRLVLSLVLCVCVAGVAEARPRRGYTYSGTTSSPPVSSSAPVSSYTSSGHGGSDQDRCQAEANYMAANNVTGHVWSCIGRFEGVGYGSSPNCNTCTPGGGMSLTGDASAQGRNGMWYRVRSWR